MFNFFKKVVLFELLVLVGANESFARQLSPEEAFQRAVSESGSVLKKNAKVANRPTLVREFSASQTLDPEVYLFATSNKDIMVVAANDCAPAMLGYFDNAWQELSADNLPESFVWWMTQYAEQIERVANNSSLKISVPATLSTKAIGPLVSTTWNQDDPYNLYCPIESDGERAVTGCVATAIAQIMNYHQWPERGTGSHSYSDDGTERSIDFSEIEFKWDLMLDNYDENSDSENCNAVATLMKACGYSVDMDYGSWMSVAVTTKFIDAAPKFFGYSDNLYYAERNNYTTSQWGELLYDQLSKGLPLIYAGRDGIWLNSTGHCFVCDGCDENGYFHFNWGWGGFCDGYFLLTDLTPSGTGIGGTSEGYNVNQGCIVNFYPETRTVENELGFIGSDLSVNDESKTISIKVVPEKVSLAPQSLEFGIELKSENSGDISVINLGEVGQETGQYVPSYVFDPDILYSLGIVDGVYKARFVYGGNDEWKSLLCHATQKFEVSLVLNESTIGLSLLDVDSKVVVSNVKINGQDWLMKGMDNELTYTVTNNRDEPIYWASWHFLVPVGEDVSRGTSLYNVNMIVPAGASVDFTRSISSSKLANLPKGDYYIVIKAGVDKSAYSQQQSIFADEDVTFSLLDSTDVLTDGVFRYVGTRDGTAVLIGLAGTDKLGGDVVIPNHVQIENSDYEVNRVLCALTDLVNVSSVKNLDIQAPFSEIPASMFRNAIQLNSIKFPEGLTSIGSSAFSGCSGFTGDLILPKGLTSIAQMAFYGCSGFTGSLTFPEGLTSIGSSAFSGCSGLTGALTLPNGLTSIGSSAFSGCSGFTGSLTLPEGLTSIGSSAFSGCSGFTGDLILPKGLTSIAQMAFYGCSGFTGSLTFPEGLTSIDTYAFYGCSGFTGSLTLPEGLTSIDTYAFYGCSGFTGSLTFPEGLTSIDTYAFYGCSGFTGSLTLPEGLTSIGSSAFSSCIGFTGALTLPEGLTTIGSSAFYGCSGFTGSLTLPEGLTSIDTYAFYGCSGFTGSLTLPEGLTTIGSSAFVNCSGIESFESLSEIPAMAESDSFAYSWSKMEKVLYVPFGTTEAYSTAAGWNVFVNIVERDIPTGIESVDNGSCLTVENGCIVVTGLSSEIAIYDLNGKCVYRGKDSVIPLPHAGFYIVVIDGTAMKISVS